MDWRRVGALVAASVTLAGAGLVFPARQQAAQAVAVDTVTLTYNQTVANGDSIATLRTAFANWQSVWDATNKGVAANKVAIANVLTSANGAWRDAAEAKEKANNAAVLGQQARDAANASKAAADAANLTAQYARDNAASARDEAVNAKAVAGLAQKAAETAAVTSQFARDAANAAKDQAVNAKTAAAGAQAAAEAGTVTAQYARDAANAAGDQAKAAAASSAAVLADIKAGKIAGLDTKLNALKTDIDAQKTAIAAVAQTVSIMPTMGNAISDLRRVTDANALQIAGWHDQEMEGINDISALLAGGGGAASADLTPVLSRLDTMGASQVRMLDSINASIGEYCPPAPAAAPSAPALLMNSRPMPAIQITTYCPADRSVVQRAADGIKSKLEELNRLRSEEAKAASETAKAIGTAAEAAAKARHEEATRVMREAAQGAADSVKGAVGLVKSAVDAANSAIRGAVDAAKEATDKVKSAVDGVASKVGELGGKLDGLGGKLDKLIEGQGNQPQVGGTGGVGLGVPSMPRLNSWTASLTCIGTTFAGLDAGGSTSACGAGPTVAIGHWYNWKPLSWCGGDLGWSNVKTIVGLGLVLGALWSAVRAILAGFGMSLSEGKVAA